MRILRKTYFTLLELLVVLTILSLGVVLTSVKLKQAYDEQRFASEVQQVLDYLRMAQDLMLIMDADIQVKFFHNPKTKQIECSIDIEKPLEKPWEKLVEKRLHLSAIRSYQFEDSQPDPLILNFTLGKMDKGRLMFSDEAGGNKKDLGQREDFIYLPGYPSQLVLTSSNPVKEKEWIEESQQLYPTEVYENLKAN